MYMGAARGTVGGLDARRGDDEPQGGTRGASSGLRLIERFTRTAQNHIDYRVTFVDPATWTAPWTPRSTWRRDPTMPACSSMPATKGNYGMANMLSTSRLLRAETGGRTGASARPACNPSTPTRTPRASSAFHAAIDVAGGFGEHELVGIALGLQAAAIRLFATTQFRICSTGVSAPMSFSLTCSQMRSGLRSEPG
jgi:hypothetical protein